MSRFQLKDKTKLFFDVLVKLNPSLKYREEQIELATAIADMIDSQSIYNSKRYSEANKFLEDVVNQEYGTNSRFVNSEFNIEIKNIETVSLSLDSSQTSSDDSDQEYLSIDLANEKARINRMRYMAHFEESIANNPISASALSFDSWRGEVTPGHIFNSSHFAVMNLDGEAFRLYSDVSTLVREAPTGTGKSYAYLIPIILSNKKVIVSTYLKSLQDQLIREEDTLKQLMQVVGRYEPSLEINTDFTIHALKGQTNYFCLRAFAYLMQSSNNPLNYGELPNLYSFSLNQTVKPFERDIIAIGNNCIVPLHTKLSYKQYELKALTKWLELNKDSPWELNEDKLPFEFSNSQQGKYDANDKKRFLFLNRHECAGQACSYYEQCPFYLARERCKKAQIVVLNHAALDSLSHIDSIFHEREVVIVDEAHNLPSVLKKSNNTFNSWHNMEYLLKELKNLLDSRDLELNLQDFAEYLTTKNLEIQKQFFEGIALDDLRESHYKYSQQQTWVANQHYLSLDYLFAPADLHFSQKYNLDLDIIDIPRSIAVNKLAYTVLANYDLYTLDAQGFLNKFVYFDWRLRQLLLKVDKESRTDLAIPDYFLNSYKTGVSFLNLPVKLNSNLQQQVDLQAQRDQSTKKQQESTISQESISKEQIILELYDNSKQVLEVPEQNPDTVVSYQHNANLQFFTKSPNWQFYKLNPETFRSRRALSSGDTHAYNIKEAQKEKEAVYVQHKLTDLFTQLIDEHEENNSTQQGMHNSVKDYELIDQLNGVSSQQAKAIQAQYAQTNSKEYSQRLKQKNFLGDAYDDMLVEDTPLYSKQYSSKENVKEDVKEKALLNSLDQKNKLTQQVANYTLPNPVNAKTPVTLDTDLDSILRGLRLQQIKLNESNSQTKLKTDSNSGSWGKPDSKAFFNFSFIREFNAINQGRAPSYASFLDRNKLMFIARAYNMAKVSSLNKKHNLELYNQASSWYKEYQTKFEFYKQYYFNLDIINQVLEAKDPNYQKLTSKKDKKDYALKFQKQALAAGLYLPAQPPKTLEGLNFSKQVVEAILKRYWLPKALVHFEMTVKEFKFYFEKFNKRLLDIFQQEFDSQTNGKAKNQANYNNYTEKELVWAEVIDLDAKYSKLYQRQWLHEHSGLNEQQISYLLDLEQRIERYKANKLRSNFSRKEHNANQQRAKLRAYNQELALLERQYNAITPKAREQDFFGKFHDRLSLNELVNKLHEVYKNLYYVIKSSLERKAAHYQELIEEQEAELSKAKQSGVKEETPTSNSDDIEVMKAEIDKLNTQLTRFTRPLEELNNWWEIFGFLKDNHKWTNASGNRFAYINGDINPNNPKIEYNIEDLTAVNAFDALRRRLGNVVWVFTSATISYQQSCSNYCEQLGIGEFADQGLVSSPFAKINNQACFYVTPDHPNDGMLVSDYALDLIIQNQGRCLWLCTSTARIAKLANTLEQKLKQHIEELWQQYIVQNPDWTNKEKHEFFEQHSFEVNYQSKLTSREYLISRLKQGKRVILIATKSFWEGINIMGDKLTLVIIDKYPHPMQTAYYKVLLQTLPYSEYQYKYYLPDGYTMFKQGIGRLIRSEIDYGLVVLLDNRLMQTNSSAIDYNLIRNQLQIDLPNFYFTTNHQEAKDFLEFAKQRYQQQQKQILEQSKAQEQMSKKDISAKTSSKHDTLNTML